jgi:ABC-2 type transport system permease protein
MRSISIIFRRELHAYLTSPLGYIIVAAALLTTGILFQWQGLGGGAQLSADVLSQFFYVASGVTMCAAILLAMRLLAEERQEGTLVLLSTSPARDVEIVLGKFLSAFVFLAGMLALTIYMPLLIMVNGKVSMGQIAAGYLGLFLLGGAVLSIGLFASSLARMQIVALLVGALLTAIMVLIYHLAAVVDAPLDSVFEQLGLYHLHFRGFMTGVIELKDVVYYLAITYLFLLLSTKTLEAKRWQ